MRAFAAKMIELCFHGNFHPGGRTQRNLTKKISAVVMEIDIGLRHETPVIFDVECGFRCSLSIANLLIKSSLVNSEMKLDMSVLEKTSFP
jgi:hypothetical protein